MKEHRYSESSEERFADAIASRVMAKYLIEKYKSVDDRRKEHFLTVAHYCNLKMDDLEVDEMAQAQHEFSFEPHSIHSERLMEQLVPEIRQALECKKDFEKEDCVY